MNDTIQAFAKRTGVTVRTLHYYDAIGLLRPARIQPSNGYRIYDASCLAQMQIIRFYRELGFPLKEIAAMLHADPPALSTILQKQEVLLAQKREQIDRQLQQIHQLQKGEWNMKQPSDTPYEQTRAAYQAEAKARWEHTAAYQEYQQRTRTQSTSEEPQMENALLAVFADFAACLAAGDSPTSPAAQAAVHALQTCISANYYTCTPEILAGLGQMYVEDARFQQTIDQHRPGTAAFAAAAIAAFCAEEA